MSVTCEMRSVSRLAMGDCIGSRTRRLAVVIGDVEPVFGGALKVPLMVFRGGEAEENAVREDRIYRWGGQAQVSVRVGDRGQA